VTTVLYNRPLFYGLPRRPKSKRERASILERQMEAKNGSGLNIYDLLAAENNRIGNQNKSK